MKLVVTVPWSERLGGAENSLLVILRRLDRARIEPLAVFLAAGPFEREVASLGVRTAVFRAGRLRDAAAAARTVRSLARLLRTERPDLVLNWTSKTQLYGGAAAALAGMADRVVWWQHSVPDRHWLDRAATLMPARAIGCSSYESARAQARLRPRRRMFVVHPGIESLRRPDPQERRALRADLGIAESATVVGSVGRLQPWKRHDRVIRAVEVLRRRGHDVHGLIVGGTAHGLSLDYAPFLHGLVQELALKRFVTFTGAVDDAAPYIAAMDVLVNASDPEPFGLVLLEAMALGVPVVAVNVGGPAEIVQSGQSGLLVPRGSDTALVEAVALLVREPALRERLATRGRERLEDRFTAERMTSETEEKLLELVP